ncbi:MAG: hypothetical protein AAF700_08430 [Pseudomonadota bacterium]
MALVAILVGGLVGFGNFVIALTFFQTGFLTALAIYSGSGLAITVFILLMASYPPLHRTMHPRARLTLLRTRDA